MLLLTDRRAHCAGQNDHRQGTHSGETSLDLGSKLMLALFLSQLLMLAHGLSGLDLASIQP
eukprot:2970840-Rhodomonas_salina.1